MSAMGLFDKLFGGRRDAGDEGARDEEVQRLLLALDDPDPARRADACRRLGELGDRARIACERLQELFTDEDGDVCNAAADAYARIERGF